MSEPHDPDGSRQGASAAPGQLPVDPDVPKEPRPPGPVRATRVLRERWDILLVIALGGALGSAGRWAVSEAFAHGDAEVAWGTVLENVSGAFALGVLMVLVVVVWPGTRYVRPFVGVGVLGGYTTFSTYMLDTRSLVVNDAVPLALGYVFGTLLAGLAAVWAGILITRACVDAAVRRHERRRTRVPVDASRTDPDHASDSDPARPNPRSRTYVGPDAEGEDR